MEERYIAAVDLGSSKIALSVAKVEKDDIQIIYYKETPSDGIRFSCVYNPQKVSLPLKSLIESAEAELQIKILQVVVGLPRYYVREENATGSIPRSDAAGCITEEEVANLKNMALDNYPLSDEAMEIIYGAVAQSFTTDDQHQAVEDDVVGMVSDKLEGNFKVFIGSKKNVSNIDKIFNDQGLAIAKKYFVPDAIASTVLYNEEIDNGVALVDLGGGVTSVSIYQNGILRHYGAIPFGGKSITGDIRLECGFSMTLSENIKLAYGACMPEKLASMSEKNIIVRNRDNGMEKQLPVKYLSEIITCREKEIIEAVLYEIQKSGFADLLRSGVVVTGGGAAMVNLCNYLKELSGYSVRMGYPLHKFNASGCTGVWETSATATVGMIMEAKKDRYLNCLEEAPKPIVHHGEEPENDIDRPDDALFAEEEFGPKVEKKPKAPKAPKDHNKGIWKVFHAVNESMGALFDGMEEEEKEG